MKSATQAESGFFFDSAGGLNLSAPRTMPANDRFRILPYASVGSETFALRPLDGRLDAIKGSAFGLGPSVGNNIFEPASRNSRVTDSFTRGRGGAFLNYLEDGEEWGRLAVTTGIGGTGAAQGFDIRAMRRFGLADGISLNFGPTLSFGEYQRFGLAAQTGNAPVITSAGAAFQLERALSPNLKASLSANYSLVQPIQGSAAPLAPSQRNRLDFGLTLSTRLMGN
ncbi:MAG: hypothetical protein ACRCWO_09870 [Bosea sp. (in: a-proteobacteria)]